MKKKNYKKDGRNFIVYFCNERKVYIGTAGLISNIAAQMICHEVMAKLKWRPTNSAIDLKDQNGNLCVAVGYKVPMFVNPQKAIDRLFEA